MKILIVTGPGISLKEPFASGIEAFVVSHAKQLIAAGHEVDVVAGEADESAAFGIINPFTSSPYIRIGWLRRRKEQQEYMSVNFAAYDIVHYNMFYPHLYRAASKLSVPSVLTLHSPADQKRIRTYQALSRRSNTTLVAISQRIQDEWSPHFAADIPLISNGINLDAWPMRQAKDDKYLLWSARINEQKNPRAAIELAKHTGHNLKIVGRITDRHYFDTHVAPFLDKHIEYIGHVTQQELSRLAQHASAYLATATWQEPFGLAALEMLASGVPIVGYNTAVPPNWDHSGVSIVTSNDWKDLVAPLGVAQLVSPEKCRAFASDMSIEKMTQQYVAIYSQKLNEKKRVYDANIATLLAGSPGIEQSL